MSELLAPDVDHVLVDRALAGERVRLNRDEKWAAVCLARDMLRLPDTRIALLLRIGHGTLKRLSAQYGEDSFQGNKDGTGSHVRS